MLIAISVTTACTKYLDKTNPDTEVDPTYWKNENSVRTYNWEFYNLFTGFGTGASGDFYFSTFSDDQTPSGFSQYPQTTAATNGSWFFGYVRKANIMLERIDGVPMPDEAKKHWKGVARFFRAYQYFTLVQTFGAVPFYNRSYDVTDTTMLYRPRDPHMTVMDSVLSDINYAIDNLRAKDIDNTVNKDVALALKSRICLFEGTYRKYHTELNASAASIADYLTQAKDAASKLMTGTYTLATSYQTSYNSMDLSSDKEMILYKKYLTGYLTHSVIGYTNSSTQMHGLSKSAVESYLCTDGQPIGLSPLYQGDNTITTVRANRDKRLLQTIDTFLCYNGTLINGLNSSTGYRPAKFLQPAAAQLAPYNDTDAPLFWLAEILLNYAEASYELGAITQADLDKSINLLRARAGVAPLSVIVAFNDPKRDADVAPLLWEIRRERRVELMMDGFRLQDIYRWKKGSYMDSKLNPDSFLGAKVLDNGKVSRNAQGYIMPYPTTSQRVFVDPKNYLSAVPTNQILLYPAYMQPTMQNPGW